MNPPIRMNPPGPLPKTSPQASWFVAPDCTNYHQQYFLRARVNLCPNSTKAIDVPCKQQNITQMKMKDFIGFLLLGGLKSFRGLNSWVGRFFFRLAKKGPTLVEEPALRGICCNQSIRVVSLGWKNDSNGGIYLQKTPCKDVCFFFWLF